MAFCVAGAWPGHDRGPCMPDFRFLWPTIMKPHVPATRNAGDGRIETGPGTGLTLESRTHVTRSALTDRRAVVVCHPDDPVVRDPGSGVLRPLIASIGGDRITGHNLDRQ